MGKDDKIVEAPVEVEALPPPKPKRKPTPEQLANLAKGQAMMKEMGVKRREIAAINKVKEAKRIVGQDVSSDEEDIPHKQHGRPRKEEKREKSPPPPKYKLVVPKTRTTPAKPRNYATKDDLAEIKTMLGKLIIPTSAPEPAPPSPAKSVTAPTANAVAVRRLSGTGFLDNMFFK